MTVKDYVISLDAGEDVALDEGQPLSREIGLSGPVGKVKSAAVDYGDGAPETVLTLQEVPGREPPADVVAVGQQESSLYRAALSHTFKDDGEYTVKVKAVDEDGDVHEDAFTAHLSNVAPVVTHTH